MKPRWPIAATIVVALAVAAMIALGVWQLRRAEWKADLLAKYRAAATMPAVAFPNVPPTDGSLLFRKASGFCLEPTGWSARNGRDRKGNAGWRHIAACRTGAEGPGMVVDMGWSKSADAPVGWRGGEVSGVIEGDRDHILLLVSDTPAPGLAASALPDAASIPDNHRAYAFQWFAFAATAAIIFGFAAFRRRAVAGKPDGG